MAALDYNIYNSELTNEWLRWHGHWGYIFGNLFVLAASVVVPCAVFLGAMALSQFLIPLGDMFPDYPLLVPGIGIAFLSLVGLFCVWLAYRMIRRGWRTRRQIHEELIARIDRGEAYIEY